MRITSLADLQVYQLSRGLADEISSIIGRPAFQNEWELRRQMADCSARIPSQIAEGFGLRSDRHVAHFQAIARGSCNEMCAHLSVALGRRLITPQETSDLSRRYERIGKGLTRWIQYLERRERRRTQSAAGSKRKPATNNDNQ
jgi:four helix bundle protein